MGARLQELPADSKQYVPPFQYECTGGGHQLASDTPLQRCPLYVHGAPCQGQLHRVGAGSRSVR